MARLTRAQLADLARTDWLCERDVAETQPCPPQPEGCGQPIGRTCVNPRTGQHLTGPPAHPRRIRAATRASRTSDRSSAA